jgi:hypothetical protein
MSKHVIPAPPKKPSRARQGEAAHAAGQVSASKGVRARDPEAPKAIANERPDVD